MPRGSSPLRRGVLAGLAALTLAVTGCSSVAAPGNGAPAQPGAAPSSGSTVTSGALGFTAPILGGGSLDAGTLSGRPVLLWFWAPY
jgi:hypothetical protein